jgi:16S rRNA pseudouridine516 synthase
MTLLQALQSQGIGSRKVCLALIENKQAFVDGVVCTNAKEKVNAESISFIFDGERYQWTDRIILMLHKPLGYECSTKPSHHASVLELLPTFYRARGVQPVGRLDVDTSGLLILTDDGQLIHRLTHPKKHIEKTYQVTTTDPITEAQLKALWQEIQLNDDPKPVKALKVAQTGEKSLTLVIDEGRYHQVRRMIAAVGNRVVALCRSQIGSLRLPSTLKAGEWVCIEESDIIRSPLKT